jgi:hypothetical protein
MEIDQKDNDDNCNSFTYLNLGVPPFKEKNKYSLISITPKNGRKRISLDSKAYNSKSTKSGKTSNNNTLKNLKSKVLNIDSKVDIKVLIK